MMQTLNGILRREKNGVWLARVYLYDLAVHIEGRDDNPEKAKFYAARAVNRLVGESVSELDGVEGVIGTKRSVVKFHEIGDDNV